MSSSSRFGKLFLRIWFPFLLLAFFRTSLASSISEIIFLTLFLSDRTLADKTAG